jgi:hypothetical protein
MGELKHKFRGVLKALKTRCKSKILSHCFSKENQVQTYMHAKIKFHAYSDI